MIDLNVAWDALSKAKETSRRSGWRSADERRSQGSPDIDQIPLGQEFDETRTKSSDPPSLSARLREALLNIEERPRRGYEWQSHRVLVEFVSSIAASLEPTPKSILDPVCGYGMLLAASAQAAQAETVHGVELKADPLKFAAEVLDDSARLVHSDFLRADDHLLDKYDLIVAEPPYGARLSEDQVAAIGTNAPRLSLDNGLVLWAASRLTDNGSALLTVSPSFFFTTQSKQVREQLFKTGCQIAGAIHIPREITRPGTGGLGGYLLLVQKGEQKELFVGQLSEDPEKRQQLRSNLLRRMPKGPPALGRLCSISEFIGFEALAARENLKRLAQTMSWAGHPATSVFASAERLGTDDDGPADVDAAGLYLDLRTGKAFRWRDEAIDSSAGRSPQDARLSNILHLKVDPELASADFMVHWFNDTRIGSLSVASVSARKTRLQPRELLASTSTIYLPPISDQALFAEGATYLWKLRAEIAELESQLWDGPEPVAEKVERIRSHNQEDRYEDWFETLPFPLARVLWTHHASNGSHRERFNTLLHYFEAAAAFLATVHLSAFMADDELWNEVGPELNQTLQQQNLSLNRASFGSWKLIFEFLSKRCEELMKEETADGEQPHAQQLFRVSDVRSLRVLTDPRLRSILQQANKIRNDWHGHGGAMSETAAKDVHDILQSLVQQTREVFGRKWQAFELIQPGASIYSQDLFAVNSRRLMGVRCNPFERRTYESEDPLETGALYLFDSVSRRGLKLLPFVTVMPSPEQSADACYVLSRAGDGVNPRWVSYHFEAESQISIHVDGVSEALQRLTHFTDDPFLT